MQARERDPPSAGTGTSLAGSGFSRTACWYKPGWILNAGAGSYTDASSTLLYSTNWNRHDGLFGSYASTMERTSLSQANADATQRHNATHERSRSRTLLLLLLLLLRLLLPSDC